MTINADQETRQRPLEAARRAIREAHHRWDHRAMQQERNVLKVGYIVAILTPVAVLLLSIQTIFFADCEQHYVAIGLIAVEVLILVVALFSLFANLLPSSHVWAGSRLRAELLRREEHLLQMRLGPYLDKVDGPDLEATVQARLAQLGNESSRAADLLVPQGPNWRDQLEDVPMDRQVLPDLVALREYLEQRVNHQHGWFQKKENESVRALHSQCSVANRGEAQATSPPLRAAIPFAPHSSRR